MMFAISWMDGESQKSISSKYSETIPNDSGNFGAIGIGKEVLILTNVVSRYYHLLFLELHFNSGRCDTEGLMIKQLIQDQVFQARNSPDCDIHVDSQYVIGLLFTLLVVFIA